MKHEVIKMPAPRWRTVRSVDRGCTVDHETVVVIHLTEDGDSTSERLTLGRIEAMDLYHAIADCLPELRSQS